MLGPTLLLPKGGKTRGPAGPKSEAESYFFVADHYDWWGKPDLRSRTSTEDFARDSFENIMFSICRYVLCAFGPYCCIDRHAYAVALILGDSKRKFGLALRIGRWCSEDINPSSHVGDVRETAVHGKLNPSESR